MAYVTSLPYDAASLKWNEQQTLNEQHQYCYCGKDRNLLDVELQCQECRNWFHSACLTLNSPPILPFITNYKLICRNCVDSAASEDDATIQGREHFERTTAGWKEISATTFANLIMKKLLEHHDPQKGKRAFDGKNAEELQLMRPQQYYFNKKDHIVPFVDANWKALCTDRVRTSTWWATLGSCIYSSGDMFMAKDERSRSAASDFTLADANLWNIRPVHSRMANVKPTPHSSRPARDKRKHDASMGFEQPAWKRQVVASTVLSSSSPGSPNAQSPASSSTIVFPSLTHEHPFNRHGFKYIPCESDLNLRHLLYRQCDNPLGGMTISQTDTSMYSIVSDDGLTVTTDKGFRMVRTNVGVTEGSWYWECIVDRANDGQGGSRQQPHVRLGVARREANLNAPVGFDGYSYAVRDLTGEKVFCSRTHPYMESFSTGDVIGFLIELPESDPFYVREVHRKRIPIKFKGRLWFEEKEYQVTRRMRDLADPFKEESDKANGSQKGYAAQKKQEHVKSVRGGSKKKQDDAAAPLPTIHGSKITVFKNGVCQGVMFENLLDFVANAGGEADMKRRRSSSTSNSYWSSDPQTQDDGTLGYYPAVSVFKGGTVTCNFGPQFVFPPPQPNSAPDTSSTHWRPMSERYTEYMVEECLWDILDDLEGWWEQGAADEEEEAEQAAKRDLAANVLRELKEGDVSESKTGEGDLVKQESASPPMAASTPPSAEPVVT
ncbi:hypothetical protein BZG36_00608 [Bifiguratus adelaidae]|uniref:B30.2/SPRY domain-containing protein n=1 Tax=Bifiguratus adelaidae TaxID=1938954 RepID=A0A261Y7Y2_9FUNG|nr:hypothetical protein BZG36_00608 [Bifiguratus adelaidae]